MVKITVELFPYGNELEKKKIGECIITNNSSDPKNGEYLFMLESLEEVDRIVHLEGKVKNFPRQKLNTWYLLRKVLYQLPSRKKNIPIEDKNQGELF